MSSYHTVPLKMVDGVRLVEVDLPEEVRMAPGEGYCQFVPLDPSVQAKGMIGENDVQAGCAFPPPLPPRDVRIREVQVHVPAADVDKIVSQVGERIVDVLRSWVSERVVFQEVAVPVDRIVTQEVEKIVEVRTEKIVFQEVAVPVDRIVTHEVHKIVQVPTDRIVTKEVPVHIEKIIEVPVDRIVQVPTEKEIIVTKEVAVHVDKVVTQQVPVYVDKVVTQIEYREYEGRAAAESLVTRLREALRDKEEEAETAKTANMHLRLEFQEQMRAAEKRLENEYLKKLAYAKQTWETEREREREQRNELLKHAQQLERTHSLLQHKELALQALLSSTAQGLQSTAHQLTEVQDELPLLHASLLDSSQQLVLFKAEAEAAALLKVQLGVAVAERVVAVAERDIAVAERGVAVKQLPPVVKEVIKEVVLLKEVPVVKEIEIEKIVYMDRIVEVAVPVERIVTVEKVVEVPVERIVYIDRIEEIAVVKEVQTIVYRDVHTALPKSDLSSKAQEDVPSLSATCSQSVLPVPSRLSALSTQSTRDTRTASANWHSDQLALTQYRAAHGIITLHTPTYDAEQCGHETEVGVVGVVADKPLELPAPAQAWSSEAFKVHNHQGWWASSTSPTPALPSQQQLGHTMGMSDVYELANAIMSPRSASIMSPRAPIMSPSAAQEGGGAGGSGASIASRACIVSPRPAQGPQDETTPDHRVSLGARLMKMVPTLFYEPTRTNVNDPPRHDGLAASHDGLEARQNAALAAQKQLFAGLNAAQQEHIQQLLELQPHDHHLTTSQEYQDDVISQQQVRYERHTLLLLQRQAQEHHERQAQEHRHAQQHQEEEESHARANEQHQTHTHHTQHTHHTTHTHLLVPKLNLSAALGVAQRNLCVTPEGVTHEPPLEPQSLKKLGLCARLNVFDESHESHVNA